MKKYEVMSLMYKEKYINDKLEEAQKKGWEIAGDILLKNESGHFTDTYFHIPMKRKIKKLNRFFNKNDY